jgi:hypothetical protein
LRRLLPPVIALAVIIAVWLTAAHFGLGADVVGPALVGLGLSGRLHSWRVLAKRAGPCVLAMRAPPRRKTWLVHIALAALAIPLIVLAALARSPLLWFFLAGHLALVSGPVIAYFTGTQLRENGVLRIEGLIPWNTVQSFAWTGQTLELTAHRQWGGARLRLPVPVDQRQWLDDWLSQRITAGGDAHWLAQVAG